MPFTQDQFFEVFRLYNSAVFPWQVVLHAIAIAVALWLGFAQQMNREVLAGSVVGLLLAILWAWMGAVYHIGFFADINPLANIFGAAFILQGVLFLVALAVLHPPRFLQRPGWRVMIGIALVLVGLFIYPLLNGALGHEFMESPAFGAPCPTTIFTLGILVLSRGVHWSLWVIPITWSAIGGSAAYALGVPQDYLLVVSGLLAVTTLYFRSSFGIRSHV